MFKRISNSQCNLPLLKPIRTSVALGAYHSLMLSPDPKSNSPILFAMGSNDFGQCGFSPNSNSGIFDEDDLEILNDWTVMMDGLEDDCIQAIQCGDFHSVALTKSGQVRTWGSGILGHGNEWYDSRPHPIRFFESIKRHVYHISARSSISACLATSKDGSAEAYVWGYLRDENGKLIKALVPSLVKNALELDQISNITCGYNGAFSIIGKRNGKSILQIYNAFISPCYTRPYAPLCESVTVIDQIFRNKPTIEITLENEVQDFSMGWDAALILENNAAKILDYKSKKIHQLSEQGIQIQNGVLGPNSIILSSLNSLYTFGVKESTKSTDVSFIDFLKSTFTKPVSKPSKSKSILDLSIQKPTILEISKSPELLLASHNDILIVET